MNELNFNLLIFIGWLFGIGFKISWTEYKIQTKRDVLQLFYTLMVAVLFWAADQFWIHIIVADKVFWRALAVAGYFIFGWANLEVLLWIIKAGKTVIKSRISGKEKELSGGEDVK